MLKNFFTKKQIQKKELSLIAYVDGWIKPIDDVDDPMFSSKALGNGVAIAPTNQIIKAPCSGVVSMIMKESKHALGLKLDNGMEILLHIGIDTVNLKGKGFTVFVNEGQKVMQGDKLLEFNRAYIESKNINTDCIMVVTNSENYDEIEFITDEIVESDKTIICKIKYVL